EGNARQAWIQGSSPEKSRPEAREGLPRPASRHLQARDRGRRARDDAVGPGPPRAPPRLPLTLDRADQRGGAAERRLVLALHRWPEEGEHRPGPQGSGGHRRSRSTGVCRDRQARRGVGTRGSSQRGRVGRIPARLSSFPKEREVIDRIDALLAEARQELSAAQSEQQVEAARVKYLGKSGSLSGLRKSLGSIAAADRPRVGKLVTDAIATFESLLEDARRNVGRRELDKDLNREKLDVTLPGRTRRRGHRHPPGRIIGPGKVYRSDSDPTHTPMFHQVECLHVEEGISMAHMRGTLDAFVKAFFGPTIQTRLRPSYFPFTEPSAEVDISHPLCGGKGCKLCKGSGWLEVLGAGMVNPDVLAGVGYDPEQITG